MATITVEFKTKKELREEDIRLTTQILYGRRIYRNVYNTIDQLSEAYEVCKSNCTVARYTDLKDMIKESVKDEVLQEAANCCNFRTILVDEQRNVRAIGNVIQLGQAREDAENEVAQMHKAEIITDIEVKNRKRVKLECKMIRLHKNLTQLHEDYENSKEYRPIRRYRLMKEMIKTLIRDKSLKLDSD